MTLYKDILFSLSANKIQKQKQMSREAHFFILGLKIGPIRVRGGASPVDGKGGQLHF